MEFYLYVNQYIGRSILSTNLISCSCASSYGDAASLGTINATHLFLTHKKLKEECRVISSGLKTTLYPITVKLNIPDNYEGKCFLVEEIEGKYSIMSGSFADYSIEKHVGIFCDGYIPFSFINGILFDNDEKMNKFWVPSLDVWYPEDLMSIISKEEFSDELEIEKLKECAANYVDLCGSEENIRNEITEKRKLLAMGYAAVRDTKYWINAKHEVNIDPYIMQLLQIDKKYVEEKISSLISKEPNSNADAILAPYPNDVLADSTLKWYPVYKVVLDLLMKYSYQSVFNEDWYTKFKDEILSRVKESEVYSSCETFLKEIGEHQYSSKGKYVEELLDEFGDAEPLKALLFVIKCPHPNDRLDDTLVAYKANQVTCRLAYQYFAAVNETSGISGSDKSDWFVIRSLDSNVFGLSSTVTGNFEIFCERVVTIEDVFAFLCAKPEIIKSLHLSELKKFIKLAYPFVETDFYDVFDKKLEDIKSRAYPEGKRPSKTEGAKIIKDLDELAKDLKKIMDDDKESSYGKLIFNDEKFRSEVLSDETKFKKWFEVDPEFWVNKYIELGGV